MDVRARQDVEREFFGPDYQDGRPPHCDSIRQRVDRLAVAAGLPRITFHDLRHSYATIALHADINPKVVSERVGHADVGYFLQTYAHVSLDDDREAAGKRRGLCLGMGGAKTQNNDPADESEQSGCT